ncbi:mismatch repair endonuclease PMS2 [Schistocerca cancellata]|uniref:mismatch repair endonuclease PMS2 n=1 Tax=Schistocerca cancellata TaxID=274614 RepID=UPI0021178036|nr:mismatch repair endonuclease PMS2 [Schistocerca cancellata]
MDVYPEAETETTLDLKNFTCRSEETKQSVIHQIDKESSSKLCSAQVVLNLAVAVKELVENSLDAGARNIDVFLKDYGSDTIEVCDDGSGVVERDFQALTLKHHTSKLRDYSELSFVETFGFRGEALNSLCALGDLTILTRHSSASCATRLEFDHNGHITKQTPCARQVGTTVCIKNLFVTFPVRHKDFHRNLRKEFSKMVQILHAYCLISTGVRITCTNQPKKGSRTTVVSTQGSNTISENITCIFGSKQVHGLMKLSQVKPSVEILQSLGLSEKLADADYPFTLEGLVSSCSHGEGRSAPDRQFYYVNSRPCEPPQVMKVVNDVYHVFNKKQYPFVFMNIKMEKDNVDVNLTPDKRQVLLNQEKLLLASIKGSLLKLYESVPSTLKVNNVPSFTQSPTSSPSSESPLSGLDIIQQWRRSPSSDSGSPVSGTGSPSSNFTSPGGAIGSPGTLGSSKRGIKRTLEIIRQDKYGRSKQHCLNNYFTHMSVKKTGVSEVVDTATQAHTIKGNGDNSFERNVYSFSRTKSFLSDESPESIKTPFEYGEESEEQNLNSIVSTFSRTTSVSSAAESKNSVSDRIQTCSENVNLTSEGYLEQKTCVTSRTTNKTPDVETEIFVGSSNNVTAEEPRPIDVTSEINSIDEEVIITADEIGDHEFVTSEVTYVSEPIRWNVDLNSITEEMEAFKRLSKSTADAECNFKFKAEIDPAQNSLAEQELRREITKDMFAKMKIVGQFNKGFIITHLDSDLFIIDQHASDEIYNFEMLQKTVSLQNQKLVVPQKLDLTYIKECLLIENLDIFNRNGFEFIIDETAEPTKRVKLSSIPISKNWMFGKDDIDELLFMLEGAPHVMCRPTRVRAMFASRACRKAVMIGTDLSLAEMRRIVDHMGEMDSPWNCPHGRPTMRHLVNFSIFFKNEIPDSGIKVIRK